jgi:glycerol-3-phosphate dehydrogenase
MTREEQIAYISSQADRPFDFIIIGGGASGLGVALDAVSRNYSVCLLEQHDFAKATSSRSTKLVHGGVRYLAQGDLGLVLEALKERGIMLRNAPHLVRNQSFIIPIYTWTDRLKYTAGLKLYDMMSGNLSFGKSSFITRDETLMRLPTIHGKDLIGGVVYQDGQFDDARLALNLAYTCIDRGAIILNYAKVLALQKNKEGHITGVAFEDVETQKNYTIQGKCVINATGIFTDDIIRMDKAGASRSIVPSQGVHLVLQQAFLPGQDALMIPETPDGRVLFAVPWYDKLVVGTTDTPKKVAELEPKALDSEVDFILQTAGQYLTRRPRRKDVLAVFAGLRPLAAPNDQTGSTKEISRSHKVIISPSKLITIAGGKWTTYRKMGEDTVSKAIEVSGLPPRKSRSTSIKMKWYSKNEHMDYWGVYGSAIDDLKILAAQQEDWGHALHPDYPYIKAQVIWAVRQEMCRSIEDFLSRRIRLLLQDAQAAIQCAPEVARLMAVEMNHNEHWIQEQLDAFYDLASNYKISKKDQIDE